MENRRLRDGDGLMIEIPLKYLEVITMTKITINLNAQVQVWPSMTSSLSREVEAYDEINIRF
jgi:hypothetical protein